MHPLAHSPTYRQETPADIYRPRGVYVPVIWALVWVMRAAICAQVMTSYLFGARYIAAKVEPEIYHRNRSLRHARTSCLRRARRCARKHGKINPEDNTPRAYAHFAYVSIMDKDITPGQFYERYIRDNDISRVQVYGMDAAHRIIGHMREGLKTLYGGFADLFGTSPLSLAAPCDPAPP